jgi:hypothetical protein
MPRRRLLLPLLPFVAGAATSLACNQPLEIGKRFELPSSDGAVITDGGENVRPDNAAEANPTPADATTAPMILWSSGLESGDTSDWTRDGVATGGSNQHLVTAAVSQEQAHTGTRSLKIAFDTADGQDHLAEYYRKVEPGPAYYAAWFFIKEPHTPATFWTVLYFFYQTQAGNTLTKHGLWDLNLNNKTVYFYDEALKNYADAVPRKPYPVGSWFHLEVRFAYEAPHNGHITVWQDGEQIMDIANLGAAPSDNLYWGLGSETDALTPSDCAIYFDDASISTGRVGP